ncbi:MAG: prepilin-type N-terminal cleavage/methylation domain-containing protein [Patescibacteria group bacterium]|jgi:prepilin-type N-terminal cleavage/methylation domain-containing protein|nr:prepilin-type N-terminal cleavage/methylation domain-containing protein [Patescibacteria group bacterium]
MKHKNNETGCCSKPVLTKFNINKKVIPNGRQGFTLLEILVIIVIIGLLAGAIIVSMAGIRENAEKKSLMRTMGTIVRAAGACDEVNYTGSPQGSPICNTGTGITYPTLDSKLTNKGYGYDWDGNDLIGYKGTINDEIIRCYVGSGTCEAL